MNGNIKRILQTWPGVVAVVASIGGGFAWLDTRFVTGADLETVQKQIDQVAGSVQNELRESRAENAEDRIESIEAEIFRVQQESNKDPGNVELHRRLAELLSKKARAERRLQAIQSGGGPR